MTLHRHVAPHRDPVHHPALAVVVVDRKMLRAAVVPDRERAGLPAEAAGEFRADRMLAQEGRGSARFPRSSCRRSLLCATTGTATCGRSPGCVRTIGCSASVPSSAFGSFGCIAPAGILLLARRAAGGGAAVAEEQALQRREHLLHGVRQGLVGGIHVGEHGVAAEHRRFLGVEQRAERRPRRERLVRVPGRRRNSACPPRA